MLCSLSLGGLFSNPVEICGQADKFYAMLYRSGYSEHLELENMLLDGLPKHTEDSALHIKRLLSLARTNGILQGMGCGKTPGMNGFLVKRYVF